MKRLRIMWLGRVNWSVGPLPFHRQWGIKRHRMGFYLKLGRYGVSVWTRR